MRKAWQYRIDFVSLNLIHTWRAPRSWHSALIALYVEMFEKAVAYIVEAMHDDMNRPG